MSAPAGVTISRPDSYTEAHHTAHGRVTGPVPLYDTGSGLVRAETLTAKYACRTQRGQTGWLADGLELGGLWVTASLLTEKGEPDPGKSFAPHTTVLLYTGIEPDWGIEFSRLWFPHYLLLKLPGHPAPSPFDAELVVTPAGGSPVTEVRTYTEVRHTVYATVAGAEPLKMPAAEPWKPDWWMRPTYVSVTWLQRSQSHITGWQIADLAVTGPRCDDLGEPLPNRGGHVRWPGGGGRPSWLVGFIDTNTPADTDGITTTPTPA
jgi:hypothetical protein